MKAALDPDILEQTFFQEVREIQDEDKEGMENMEEEEDELPNEKIKVKNAQFIFFYLKTAKKQ